MSVCAEHHLFLQEYREEVFGLALWLFKYEPIWWNHLQEIQFSNEKTMWGSFQKLCQLPGSKFMDWAHCWIRYRQQIVLVTKKDYGARNGKCQPEVVRSLNRNTKSKNPKRKVCWGGQKFI